MYLALDVGGTSINIGLFKELDPNSRLTTALLKVKNDFTADMQQIEETVKGLTTEPIQSLGIGVPGTINTLETEIVSSANLSNWARQDILSELKSRLKIEDAFLCHDVKAAALSECMFGNVKDNFAFVIWGTGIGCSYVRFTNNVPTDFQQVELGYQTITKTIELEGQIYPGYLEYYCGGGRLAQRFSKSVTELTESEWDTVLDDLSYGIANLLMLNHAPTLVFSGGVAMKQSHRIPKLAELVSKKIRSKVLPNFQLAKYGEDAGMYGALGLIKYRLSGSNAKNSAISESVSFIEQK